MAMYFSQNGSYAISNQLHENVVALNPNVMGQSFEALEARCRLQARRYRDLGYAYHQIPFQIRNSALDTEWQEFCWASCVVTDNAELPNLVLLFGTIEHTLGMCGMSLGQGHWVSAHHQLSMVKTWLVEVDDNIMRLSWAVAQCENCLEYVQQYVWARGPDGRRGRVRMSRWKIMMRARFIGVLPAICRAGH